MSISLGKHELVDFLNAQSNKIATEENSRQLYFIRDTNRKNNRFQIRTTQVEGRASAELRDIVVSKIRYVSEDLQNDRRTVRDFFDENNSSRDVSSLSGTDVPQLQEIVETMRQSNLDILERLEDVQNFETYAVEFNFRKDDDRIIYFRKITPASLLSKKLFTKFAFSKGKFDSIEKDVFAIDRKIDCVYFEREKILLVLHKTYTEQIFNLISYYQEFTKQAIKLIQKTGWVSINDRLIKSILGKTQITKRITNLQKQNKFDKDIDHFKKFKAHMEKHKQQYTSKKIDLEIVSNTLKIEESETRFETFLLICNQDLDEDPITGTPYIVKEKETLK